MVGDLEQRAVTAAGAVAAAHGLAHDRAVVISSGSNVLVHLRPAPVVARVMAGTVDSAAADKAAHFLDVAGAFGLPCVFLADNPGVLAGTLAERQGIFLARDPYGIKPSDMDKAN